MNKTNNKISKLKLIKYIILIKINKKIEII